MNCVGCYYVLKRNNEYFAVGKYLMPEFSQNVNYKNVIKFESINKAQMFLESDYFNKRKTLANVKQEFTIHKIGMYET